MNMDILDIMDTEMAFACHRQPTPYRRMLAMPYGMLLATTTDTKLWEIGNHGLLYYYLDIP